MSTIRVLVGTRKGAFILTADGTRDRWEVSGPHFGGWEIYHMKGSPADPDRLYASQSSGWFGQVIQRSSDGGKTWEAVGNKFAYEGATGTHLWYDGTPHPWEFARVWHLEPSLTDPETVYAGVEDAALFRSTDGGQTWRELSGLRGHGTGPHWQPGAGGMCLHTVVLDPGNPQRMFVAISAAGELAGRRTSTCRPSVVPVGFRDPVHADPVDREFHFRSTPQFHGDVSAVQRWIRSIRELAFDADDRGGWRQPPGDPCHRRCTGGAAARCGPRADPRCGPYGAHDPCRAGGGPDRRQSGTRLEQEILIVGQGADRGPLDAHPRHPAVAPGLEQHGQGAAR